MITVRTAREKCIWPRHYIVVNGIEALSQMGFYLYHPMGLRTELQTGQERRQIISRDKNRGKSIHWSIFLRIKRMESEVEYGHQIK